jgi:uncharacterized protein (TIGR02594 family)
MKTLQSDPKFSWLLKETAPKVLVEAVKRYGIVEIPGPKSNETILSWAKELGINWYVNDDTPWCGLLVASVVSSVGYAPVKESLRALSWQTWGTAVTLSDAALGDVLVFKRTGGGHVGFYVAEDDTNYYVLGGNQSNQVNIAKIAKSRCVAVRRSPWKIAQPPQVRKVFMKDLNMTTSTNEA